MARKTETICIDETKKVGSLLKKARLEKKLSLEKISEKTKISVHYLDAIERNDFSVLPGYVYASGFVRTYAKFLDLDVGTIYDMYRDETSIDRSKVSLSTMEPEKEVGLPHKKEILIAIALLVVIYILWSIFSGTNKDEVQQKSDAVIVSQTETSSVVKKTPVIFNKNEKTKNVKNKVMNDSASASFVANTEYSDDIKKKEEHLLKEDAEKVQTSDTDNEDAAVDDVKEVTETQGKTYGSSRDTRVVLVANSEVWIQISDDDKIIFARILKIGDKYKVPDNNDELTLRAGNAAALDVFVDGQKKAPFGKRGHIVREEKIDAESLLSRDE